MKIQIVRRILIGVMLIGATIGAAAAQAEAMYVAVTGQVQGPFRGEIVQKNFEGKFSALKFRYGVGSPRDAATGMATGRVQQKPVIISKAWGAASSQLYQALLTNENLALVTIDFVTPDGNGLMVLTHRIRLTNARVVDISQSTESLDPARPIAATAAQIQLEEVSLTFQRIEIEDVMNKTVVTSDALRQ
jgi:type VI secretion system secreted protein Hcp